MQERHFTCDLAAGHDGYHRGASRDGGTLQWPRGKGEESLPVPSPSPGYYKVGPFECMDVIDALNLGWNLGCAFKYIWRCGRKGGPADAITDLRKAITYLEREIRRRELL